MRGLVLSACLAGMQGTHAQRILHYTETSGFDHGTRAASFALFNSIADAHGWSVTDDEDGAHFNTLAELSLFDVVVFSNTSGADLLDQQQRNTFEAWVAQGGAVLGIHAATDTYRHSSANGNNTGQWDLYAELIGASVQESPNHVDGTPLYAISHVGVHPVTTGLPDPWMKNEEYYYWENGYYGPDNTEVLRVEETVGPNSEVNSYDAPRPMSWVREPPAGGRVFYTALGHAVLNYTDDPLFRAHVENGLTWLLDAPNAVPEQGASAMTVSVDAPQGVLHVTVPPGHLGDEVMLMDASGRLVCSTLATGTQLSVGVHGLRSGIYHVCVGTAPPVRIAIITP